MLGSLIFFPFRGGACYHQLPCRAKYSAAEKPDIYILGEIDGLPHIPVLTSDFKKDNINGAMEETIGYKISCPEGCTTQCVAILGLAMTCRKVKLMVCIGHTKKMQVMDVCKVELLDEAIFFWPYSTLVSTAS